MRKNDRFEFEWNAAAIKRRGKVFGIKSMAVVMTTAMMLSGVPTQAIAEELQEAGVIAAQSEDAGQSDAGSQQAVDTRQTTDQSSQGSTDSTSGDSAAATQDDSQSAQQAATADLALELNNASISYKGQVIAQPAQKVTASTSDDFTFTVIPDNGYKLNKVTLAVNGSERELAADASGQYTVPAADVAAGSKLTLATEQEQNGETAEDATPIENSAATQSATSAQAIDAPMISGPTEVLLGTDGIKFTWSGGNALEWNVYNIEGGNALNEVSHDASSATYKTNVDWVFNGDSIKVQLKVQYQDPNNQWGRLTSEPFTVTVKKRDLKVSNPPSFKDDEVHYWVPEITDAITGEKLDPSNGKLTINYYKDGVLIGNQYNIQSIIQWQPEKLTGAGEYRVEVVSADGWAYKSGTTSIDIPDNSEKPTLTVSGPDTVEQFNTIQLEPTLSNTKKDGTYTWSSNNENILTVDKNGKVTGVSQGTTTVTVTWTSKDGKTTLTATHDVTVTKTTASTDNITFYYLNDPDGDLDGIKNFNQWEKVGSGRVNLTGLKGTSAFPKDNGNTKIYNAADRIVSWPSGLEGSAGTSTFTVKRGSTHWNKIYANYKKLIEQKLPGVTVTEDNVKSIQLIPYKMTNNDDGVHVDCQVRIEYANLYSVRYNVWDPSKGDTGYVTVGSSSTYLAGSETSPSDFKLNYPATKTVDDVEYTFSGWCTDANLTQSVSMPYTVGTENLTFYAKYVAGRHVLYNLDGGTWGNGAATSYKVDEGKTHTVLGQPTKEGYDFAGWTVEGLDGKTAVESGETFTMPGNNVTITAKWTKKPAKLTVNYRWGDKDDNKLIESATVDDKSAGDVVTFDLKNIDGYTVKAGQTSSVVLKAGENTVDVYYYKNVKLTAKSGTKTYNGKKQTLEGYTPSETTAKFEGITAAGSGTDAGEYAVTFAKDPKGTVSKDKKYIVSEVEDGKLTISPISNEVVVTITGKTDSVTYDGKEHSVKGYDVSLPENTLYIKSDIKYSGEATAKGTDAGEYAMGLKAEDFSNTNKNFSNVKFVVKDGKLTVEKRKVTLTSDSGDKKYDGQTLTRRGVTVSGDGFAAGENVSQNYTWYDDNNILPGEYTNTFDYALKKGTNPDNYEITKVYGKLIVNKRTDDEKLELTVKAKSDKREYNAQDQTLSGLEQDTFEIKGVTFHVSGLEAKGVTGHDAGKYTNKIAGTAKVTDAAGNDVTDQFKVKTEDGTLTITKKAATITSVSATKEYDGKALTAHEVTTEGFFGTDEPTITYTGSQTKVGTSDNTFTYSKTKNVDKNYDVEVHYGTLTVTKNAKKVVVNIQMNSDTVTYDGKDHEVSGYTVTSISGAEGYTADDIQFGGSAVSGKDAGTYANSGKGKFSNKNDAYGDVEFVVTDGALTISPRPVTLTSGSAEKTYDGSALTKDEVAVSGEGFVGTQGLASATCTGSQLDAGTSSNPFTYTLKSDTNANNYVITEVQGKLTVKPVTDEVVVKVNAPTEETTYNGKKQSTSEVTFTCDNSLYDVANVQYTGAKSVSGTDAGTYTETIAGTSLWNGSKNFTNVSFEYPNGRTIRLTIKKRDLKVTTESAQKTYDGTALTAGGKLEGLVKGETADFKVTGSQTEAGSSANGYELTWNGSAKESNYNAPAKDLGTLTVNAKEFTVGQLKDTKYNGREQKQAPVVKSGNTVLVEGRDYELTYEGDTTNAGAVKVTVTGKGNYAGTVERWYKIQPRHVTLASDTLSKTYDGTALAPGTAYEIGEDSFVTADVSKVYATGSITNPGSVENTIAIDKTDSFKDGNYVITYKPGTLTVEAKKLDAKGMTVSPLDDVVYDGREHKFEPTVKDGSKTLVKDAEYTLSWSDNVTDAGKVTVTVTGKGNYAGTATVDYRITKRPVTLQSNSATKSYDGTALEDHDVIVTSEYDFVDGEVSDLTATGSITEPGTVVNGITFTKNEGYKDSNYKLTVTEGKLTVTAKSVDASGMEVGGLVDVTYNGQDQALTPEVKDGDKVLVAGTDYDVSWSKDTKNVGIVTVTITGKGNYIGTTERTYRILPAKLTVKTESASRAYNGKSLTAGGTIDGFVNGETAGFTVTGKQKSVGSSTNTYDLSWNGTAKKSNYTIDEQLGTLTVTESADIVTVTTVGGTFTYDGLTHEPTVTVTGLPEGYTVRDASSNTTAKNVNKGVKVTADNLVIVNAEGEDVTSKLNIEKIDGTLTITPAELTVTTPSASKVYDGTALTAEGTVSGLVEGETVDFKTTGSQTKVGESKNDFSLKWTGADASNYTVNKKLGKLKVTEQSIDQKDKDSYTGATVDNPQSTKYDAADHQWTPTVKDAAGNVLTAGKDYTVIYKRGDTETTDFKNAGTITAVITGKGNFTGSVTREYKITERDVVLTSADGSWTYDGSEHAAKSVDVTGDGFAKGEGVDYKNFATVTDATADPVKNTFDYVAKDGTDLGNYNVTVKTGKLIVTKAQAEGNITLATKDLSRTYNGKALTANKATANVKQGDAAKVEYSTDGKTWTEDPASITAIHVADSKTVYVRASSKGNFDGYIYGQETLTITPAALKVVTKGAEKTFNGTALTADGSIEGFVNGEEATFKVTGSQTAKGESDNTYTLTWDKSAKQGDYAVSATVGKLKVTERSIDDADYGMVVSTPQNVEYDGAAHQWTPTVTDNGKTLASGTDYEVSYSTDDFTDVTGTITVTIKGKGNYKGTVTRTYQITPAPLTITTEGASKVYDGDALTNDVASISGLKNNETATIHATGTQTEVGESDNGYQITWDGTAKQDNYTIESAKLGKLVVSETKAAVTATPLNVTATYDGKAHGTEVQVTGLPKGYSVKKATSSATATDVADDEVTAKVDELVIINAQGKDVTSKLNITRGTATIKITPAPLTVTTAGASKEYDGTALTASGIKVEGLIGNEEVAAKTTGSRTKVGKTDNTFSIDWTGAKESNYSVTKSLGTLEVTPSTKAVTLASGSAERVYNGKTLASDSIEAAGLPTGFTVKATMTGAQTDAGSSENTVESYQILDAKGDDVTKAFTNVTVKPGSLTVTPKEITVETEGATKVFDGTALTNEKGSIKGLVKGETATVVTNGSQTAVGSSDNGYTISWESAKAGNYKLAGETLGKLIVTGQSIKPGDKDAYAGVTVDAPSDSLYDGVDHQWVPTVTDKDGNVLVEGTDYTVIYKRGDSATGDFKNAGTITVTITGAGNYTGSVTRTYAITKRAVTLTSATQSWTFDGEEHSAPAVTVTGDGFVEGEGVDYSGFATVREVTSESVENAFDYKAQDGTELGNYDIAVVNGTLAVTGQSVDPDDPTPDAYKDIRIDDPTDSVYDGAKHQWVPTVTDKDGNALRAGEDYTVSYRRGGSETDDFKDAGTVTVTIAGKGNYTGAVTKSYRITPAQVTVSTPSASKVYDGKALTAKGEVSGLVEGETVGFKTTGTQTKVGTSDNTYELAWTGSAKKGNYEVVSIEVGKLTVTQSTDQIVVTTTGGEYTYDGKAHGATVSVSALPEGYALETATSFATATDVTGKAGVAATADSLVIRNAEGEDVTAELNIKKVDGTIVVSKRELTVTTPSASKVYDGTALTAAGTVSGLVEGEDVSFVTTGSQTEEGTSDNTYSLAFDKTAKESNYTVKKSVGKLTVSKQSIDPGDKDKDAYKGVTVDSPTDSVYDGSDHQWVPTVTGEDGIALKAGEDYTVAYKRGDTETTDFKNVGTITVVIKGKGNYTGTVTREYKITKRDVTLTSADGSWTYDGSEHTAESVTVTGDGFVEGEGVDYSGFATVKEVTSEPVKNAFDYKAKKGTDLNNYKIKVVEGALSVTGQSIDPDDPTPGAYTGISIDAPADSVYDGKDHKWTPAVTDKSGKRLSEGTDYEVSYSTDDFTDVTGTITVTITGKGNYIGSVTRTHQITPAPLTVETPSASKVYDGSALTAEGKVSGLVDNETVSFKTTGAQTKVGTSDNTYELAWTGSAKEGNYQVVSAEVGKLTVTQSSDRIVVTTTGGTYTYDGRAHGATVSVSALPEGYRVRTAESTATATDVTDGVAATADSLVIENAEGEDVTSDLNIERVDGTIAVKPAELTVTTPSASKVYDGTALTAAGELSGLVDGETAELETTGTQTEVGTSDNAYRINWNGTAKESNYTVKATTGTLEVTGQSIDPGDKDAYQGISVDSPSDVTYDGASHQWAPTVTDKDGNVLVAGTDYDVTYDTNDFVDAGTVTATITGKGNYTGSVTRTYAIKPAPVSIKTDSASKVYDGHALTAGGKVEGLVEGETVSFETTGSQTKAGTSDNTYELAWNGSAKQSNYEVVSVEVGKLTVTESSDQIVVTTTGGTYAYDGRAHGATVSVSQLPEGYALKTAESTATATDVTDGVKATADRLAIVNAEGEDVTAKLNIKKVDGTITVKPAELTVETDSASKVYDGTALTAAGRVTGLVNGEKVTLDVTGSQTEVGTSDNTYELKFDKTAKAKNYTVTHETVGTLTVTGQSINPDDPDGDYRGITVDKPADVVYDGENHQWIPAVADAEGNELEEGTDYEVSYGDAKDFRNVQTITVTITGRGNYKGSVVRAYRITPAPLHVVTGSASKVFDGSALTDATVTVDGLAASDRIGISVTGSQTQAGSSANTYQIDWMQVDPDNYELTDELGTLTVTPAPATPQNPTTPATPATPNTPATPGTNGGTTGGNGVINTIATALQDGYNAVTGNGGNDGGQAAEEQIFDGANPLGKYADKRETCWVHWYMIICAIVTVAYGIVVGLRRNKHTRRLEEDLDKILGDDDKAQE